MASIITFAGEKLFAAKAQANEQLDIDTFIFANVPGQDATAPINREEGLPNDYIVHQQIVQQVGRINDNVVVYSTVLDSVTGPFEFNWVGLYSSVNNTLVAINHIPTTPKTVTADGVAGNTLNRNFGIEYSGIADLTGIDVAPETWQLDFTARLQGMDKLTQQLAADMNGKDWFIGDGFKVEPRETVNTFKILPGVGYVSGLRVELENEHIFNVESYPKFVYVDAWFEGDANSTWSPSLIFRISDIEIDDYTDAAGIKHYVNKLAELTAFDTVEDFRRESAIDSAIANKAYQVHVEGAIRSNKERFEDRPDVREFQNLVSDGLWNDAISAALNESTTVLMPSMTFDVSDTIRLNNRGFGLTGYSKNSRNYRDSTFKIRWRGGDEPRKAVVLVGQNEVGAEPLIDATDNILSNVLIDCGNSNEGRAGFGVYGTYLTNETLLERITVLNSAEYNFYLAKSWYATFKNLVSLGCKNNGIALGMPLRYADGTIVNWQSSAPIEINNAEIYNLRSHSAGQRFSIDNPETFNPKNVNYTRHGYGVGLGVGNSFNAKRITSEASGGFNLYCYNDFQPLKNIEGLYLESGMKNSGLDPATDMANMLIESVASTGGKIEIENGFLNYQSGGIYLLGEKRPIGLKNIYQPRFLKALNGQWTASEIDAFVHKENCYSGLGYQTTDKRDVIAYETHNIRYNWEIEIPFDATIDAGMGFGMCSHYVYIKANGEYPSESTFVIEYEDGTTESFNYPSPLPSTWYLLKKLNGRAVKVKRGGGASDYNANVTFNIVSMAASYI